MPASPLHRYHRQSIRLPRVDYAGSGGYFLTFCTHQRAHLFGDVRDGALRLTDLGQCAAQCWLGIPEHFETVTLDALVIMPNHVHAIVWITRRRNDAPAWDPTRSAHGTPPGTIGSIVREFKIGVTKWAHANTPVRLVWLRNYYESIIRDRAAVDRIRRYIANNPPRWVSDRMRAQRQRDGRWTGTDRRGERGSSGTDGSGERSFAPTWATSTPTFPRDIRATARHGPH